MFHCNVEELVEAFLRQQCIQKFVRGRIEFNDLGKQVKGALQCIRCIERAYALHVVELARHTMQSRANIIRDYHITIISEGGVSIIDNIIMLWLENSLQRNRNSPHTTL